MSNPRILIADDNPLSLHFFAEALNRLGFDLVLATDGVIAAERAAAARFNLLLLDARMPQLDGSGALARIRAQSGPSQTAIAWATTADDSATTRADLIGAGFSDVLIKPLGIDALRSALRRCFPVASTPSNIHVDSALLDNRQALTAAGGDAAIVAALRGLLLVELGGLPEEMHAMAQHGDANALRERLHRLDASAGFCGVPALARASAQLRAAADAPTWSASPLAAFLDVCSDCVLALTSSENATPI